MVIEVLSMPSDRSELRIFPLVIVAFLAFIIATVPYFCGIPFHYFIITGRRKNNPLHITTNTHTKKFNMQKEVKTRSTNSGGKITDLTSQTCLGLLSICFYGID